MDTTQLLGPFALTVGLLFAVYGFLTGKVRRESEVTELQARIARLEFEGAEKDKRIEAMSNELAAVHASRLEEQRLRREAMAVVRAADPEEWRPPRV